LPSGYSCPSSPSGSYKFTSTSNNVAVGNSCSLTALVKLYQCTSSSCTNYQKFGENYKVNGQNPTFNGLGTGNSYIYFCYNCVSSGTTTPPTTTQYCYEKTNTCRVKDARFKTCNSGEILYNSKEECLAKVKTSTTSCISPCQTISETRCGQSVQPKSGCYGSCQGTGTLCSRAGEKCESGVCVSSSTPLPTNPPTTPVCTQEAGTLCNPTTKQIAGYSNGCDKINLFNQGYSTEMGNCQTPQCIVMEGQLCNPSTKQFGSYAESCQKNTLLSQGYLDNIGICSIQSCTEGEKQTQPCTDGTSITVAQCTSGQMVTTENTCGTVIGEKVPPYVYILVGVVIIGVGYGIWRFGFRKKRKR